ncbi:MAG: NTP pyrophosphohydrolase [Spirochaetae bacterium HGW-Spirochaetae-1]|jgi:8-oxo-dGTP pyrophosphatase MutT (NUDIX family)|nr:MAG: NTP pyrophosphohydrolase [Spirochaetae bacterium HGW-Spirochaetae-1]
MKKWIQKQSSELIARRVFTLRDIDCHHPEKDIHHTFFRLETLDWINVIAVTGDNRFIMVKQHRLGNDEITIETTGGLIDHGEDPLEAARRELREETGYSPARMTLLKKLAVNPAIMDNYIYYYLADGCVRVSDQDLDKEEDIEVLTYSRDEIRSMMHNGEIDHALVITGLLLFFDHEQDI